MHVDLSQKEIGWVRLALSAAMKNAGAAKLLPGQPGASDFKGILSKLEKHRRRTMATGR